MTDFLKKTYPNAKTIDSNIPINESVYTRKPFKKKSGIKKKEKMHDIIKKIWPENFIIFKAYVGITFSFQ